MGFFANSWVTGIVTGIMSGLLVFFVTNFLFDNKRKREYVQHIKEANVEIINALKPYIAEQGLPDYEVLCSLINSTSRKHFISYKDLFTPSQICEELIREIMGDVYISSEKKKEYAESVAKYKNANTHVSEADPLADDKNTGEYYRDKYMQSMVRIITYLTGFIVIITLIVTILIVVNPELAWRILFFPPVTSEDLQNNKSVILIAMASAVVTFIGTAITLISLLRNTEVNRKVKKVLRLAKSEIENVEKVSTDKDADTMN